MLQGGSSDTYNGRRARTRQVPGLATSLARIAEPVSAGCKAVNDIQSYIINHWRYFAEGGVFVLCAALLAAYQVRLIRRIRSSPTRTVQGLNTLARIAWVNSCMQSGRDILAVQTLRNSTMAATLMASTAIILILGILNMIANADKVAPALHLLNPGGSHEPAIWFFKLMLILVDFFVAFFSFSLSVRGYNHVGFLINVPHSADGKGVGNGVTPAHVAAHLNRAAAYYTLGMRTYYVAVPLVLWLFGPIWMLVATIALLLVMKHLDHLPQQD